MATKSVTENISKARQAYFHWGSLLVGVTVSGRPQPFVLQIYLADMCDTSTSVWLDLYDESIRIKML